MHIKDPVRKGFLVEKDFDEKLCPQLILPIESILDDNYFVNSQGIVEEREPFCKHCGAKKYSRKGYNWRLLYLDNGTPIRIKVKRYKCKKNAKGNSKLSSHNTGGNSATILIK